MRNERCELRICSLAAPGAYFYMAAWHHLVHGMTWGHSRMRRLHKWWPARHLYSHHPQQKVCLSAHLRAVRQLWIQVQPLQFRQAAPQCWLLEGPAVEQLLLCQWRHGWQPRRRAHLQVRLHGQSGQGALVVHLRGGRTLHLQEGWNDQCSACMLPP